MSRLTDADAARIPLLLEEHHGNISAVAKALHTSRQTVYNYMRAAGHKTPPRPTPTERNLTQLDTLAETRDLGEGQRTRAFEIGEKVIYEALKEKNWELLLKAGMLMCKIADGKSNAYRMAVTYIDQRGQQAGAADAYRQAVLQIEERLRGKVSDEVLILVMGALQEARA